VNGTRYEGDWREGKKHGRGKLIWTNGNYYDGGFANDERDGIGAIFKADATITPQLWLKGTKQREWH
jgi:hypothetical protein